ncbi:anhydro-N-acetylmuramic acid kinase [Salpingoeca rosetta]|uniref:Anhydro-N-acetylmuramic acid kinase n=1 Tax=Salpingoeca rosetta (strain ATCC 50818 / BSB-021) TaxID=946362 RepID=F2U8J8_SALR5|nr:anhydro-N-acetylmuramic acid kinase [Salpingoeca rosetta]EGD72706.1 anhydro-N-acetylmuramic acid kinase [Salpingoeca rosetta]|eukprot:XP_004994529.1 anhydro-N-acetylmuramic acid kinase [Salpingoeca rosetta]
MSRFKEGGSNHGAVSDGGAGTLCIGLMSGTSCDAIDAALVEIRGAGFETSVRLLKYIEVELEADVRQRLLRLGAGDATTASELTLASNALGEAFAAAAHEVVRQAGKHMNDVAFIGSHGQTVFHDPDHNATLQIGSPFVIAQRTGCWTVADFRPADMALGGQGAPLVPYVDLILHRSAVESRLLLNIGGIANITVLPANATAADVVAFDTGPGNMLMDMAAARFTHNEQRCDRNGAIAARGVVHTALLAWLLDHPFLHKAPPKSTGRDEFGAAFFARLLEMFPDIPADDVLATLNAFTARTVCDAALPFIKQHSIAEVWVSGGGAHNPVLISNLQRELPDACRVVQRSEDAFDTDAREAVAFAVLANETMHGNTANVPAVTGATAPAVLGAVFPGTRRVDMATALQSSTT